MKNKDECRNHIIRTKILMQKKVFNQIESVIIDNLQVKKKKSQSYVTNRHSQIIHPEY